MDVMEVCGEKGDIMEVCGEKGVGSGRSLRSRSRVSAGSLIMSEPALVTGPRSGGHMDMVDVTWHMWHMARDT